MHFAHSTKLAFFLVKNLSLSWYNLIMKQAVFWSKDKNNLGRKDESYLVNQTLMYGDLKDIKILIKNEGLTNVRKIFVSKPTKIYTPQAFNFIKNFILKIDIDLDPSKYVKALY